MDPITWFTRLICNYLCGAWQQERRERKEKEARLSLLKAEVEENINLSSNPLLAGGLAVVRFRLNGWDGIKVDLDKYPEELKRKLHDAYLEMGNFNSLVDEFGRTRDGRIMRVAEIQSREIVEKLSAIKALIS